MHNRKNALFAGSDEGGNWAVIATLRGGLENLHTEIIGFSASEQPGRLRDRSRE
jgi:hypothetical protein